MKPVSIFVATILLFTACRNKEQTMNNQNFIAEKVTRAATITVNAKVGSAFPLFGVFEERKWSKEWNPTLIYPPTETIEEGTTFKTHGHGHNEKEFLWRVSKYEPEKHLIQYLVSSENRYWTITVKCSPASENTTLAEITYTLIGLNDLGNEINKHSIEKMYKNNLKDWEEELNYYLANNTVKPY